MANGTVFDIQQMTLADGPGVRTTVFLKGCPLRCQWCHNPEGLSPRPQLMVSPNGCAACGACRRVCPSPERCVACGACVKVCPANLRKICGVEYTPEELAELLLADREYLTALGGGVTFSGGEPTLQSEFLLETLALLKPMHRAVETCGYCPEETFLKVIEAVDYVIMDIKHTDSAVHRRYTGVDNAPILSNLELLKKSGKPFRIRVPLIPGVNDSRENLETTARLVAGAPMLEKVELLSYHQTAGAKYSMVGMTYQPEFDVSLPPEQWPECFREKGICCDVL